MSAPNRAKQRRTRRRREKAAKKRWQVRAAEDSVRRLVGDERLYTGIDFGLDIAPFNLAMQNITDGINRVLATAAGLPSREPAYGTDVSALRKALTKKPTLG